MIQAEQLEWSDPLGEWSLVPTRDPDVIQRLLEQAADFFFLLHGRVPNGADAAELLDERPPGTEPQDRILSVVKRADGTVIGLVSAFRHYPAEHEWFLGDLLLVPSARNRGIGRACYDAFEAWVRGLGGRSIHLVVQEANPAARRFWERRGFRFIADTTQTLGSRPHRVARLKRDLTT